MSQTKVVPVEPTEEMKKAGSKWTNYKGAMWCPEDTRDEFVASRVYQAMLAAAPVEGTAAQQSAGSDASIAPERESSRMESPDSVDAAAPSVGEFSDAEIDSLCERLLHFAQADCQLESSKIEWAKKVSTLCAQAKRGRGEPVAWAVYCDGEINNNIFASEAVAWAQMERLNAMSSEHERKIVPLVRGDA